MIGLLNEHASIFYLLALSFVGWHVRHRGTIARFAIIGAFLWFGIANGIYFIAQGATELAESRCGQTHQELYEMLRITGMQLASMVVGATYYCAALTLSGQVFWRYFYLMVAVFAWSGVVWFFDLSVANGTFAVGHNALFIGMLVALWYVEEDDDARFI